MDKQEILAKAEELVKLIRLSNLDEEESGISHGITLSDLDKEQRRMAKAITVLSRDTHILRAGLERREKRSKETLELLEKLMGRVERLEMTYEEGDDGVTAEESKEDYKIAQALYEAES